MRSSQTFDGGFAGRDGKSDLYYTNFALDILHAFKAEYDEESLCKYLQCQDFENLDFISLCALLRCQSYHLNKFAESAKSYIFIVLEKFRSVDGCFAASPSQSYGNPYSTFCAMLVEQSWQESILDKSNILAMLNKYHAQNGGFCNEQSATNATTPNTAAALCLQYFCGVRKADPSCQWLLSRFSAGGFTISAQLKIPNLLATSVALQALSLYGCKLDENQTKQCLTFIEAHWHDCGGFVGIPLDDLADCEYCYYAITALGLLLHAPV